MNERSIINGPSVYPDDNMLPDFAFYEDSSGAREARLSTMLLARGIIQLNGTITRDTLSQAAQVLLHLADQKTAAKLLINSGGGEVQPGLGIYDMIQSYPYDIDIYCVGTAASMAAVLLAGGRPGHRFILPHSSVMIHEPLIAGGMGGSASTIEKTAKSILETRDTLNGIIAKHTGKTLKEINKATETDNWMTAEEAVKFGICDEIRDIF